MLHRPYDDQTGRREVCSLGKGKQYVGHCESRHRHIRPLTRDEARRTGHLSELRCSRRGRTHCKTSRKNGHRPLAHRVPAHIASIPAVHPKHGCQQAAEVDRGRAQPGASRRQAFEAPPVHLRLLAYGTSARKLPRIWVKVIARARALTSRTGARQRSHENCDRSLDELWGGERSAPNKVESRTNEARQDFPAP